MPVREDCRHYIMQTVRAGDKLERCRVAANETLPFGCPDGCVFYEPRKVSSAGWHIGDGGRRKDPPRSSR
ncbi:MAG: hypothetical protein ACRD1G_12195 [Acidimicrobiales bacterium]